MDKSSNMQIMKRLLEIAKNPKGSIGDVLPFKEQYIFLSNILNVALNDYEKEFDEMFNTAVNQYKNTLANEGKGYGWFHSVDNLLYVSMQISQLKYIIYGEESASLRDYTFNEELKEGAYKDFIEQVDRTVLMTPEELKKHNEKINRLSLDILEEILKEEKL